MAVHASIPQEIIDYIIDHNHSDLYSLRACSLVSSSWRLASQYHLFHTVTIVNSSKLSRFVQVVNESPQLAWLVRELCFNTYANYRDSKLPLWIDQFVTVPIDKLVRLQSLRFEKVEWDRVRVAENTPLLAGLSRFTGVKELHFSACSFSTFFEFEEIVSAVRCLSKLSIDLISWTTDESKHCVQQWQMKRPPKLSLSAVKFDRYSDPARFSEWLLRMPGPPSLESVTFKWVSACEAKPVGRLLGSLGRSLKYLRIGCRFNQDPALANLPNEWIDLSLNRELRSLHLVISDLQDHLTPWVPVLLFQVAHAPLVRIAFEMWLHDWRQLESPVWDEVERLLSRQAFASVQEVVFIHRGDLDMKATSSTFQSRFPELHIRRLLRIQNHSPFLAGELK